MNRLRTGEAARYARAIERRWSELLAQAVVLSPREWTLIARWHSLGVSLEIIEEAMVAEMERERAGDRPRRLAALARPVEEAWQLILDGRRAASATVGCASHAAPATSWRQRLEAEPAGSPLGGLLGELLAHLESGTDERALDEELDRRLVESVSPTLRNEVLQEVDRDLEPFRSRMAAEHWEVTRRRACVDRLRRRLDLPRLAGEPAEA